MAGDTNCCCDLTPHPEDKLTWTGTRAAGKRYQLIRDSCHVEFIEVIIHTSAEVDSATVRFFTSAEPDAGTPDGDADENVWQLTVGMSVGNSAYTPECFAGLYFRNGVFAEIVSPDSSVEVIINIVYYDRAKYIPALPERPYERRVRLWNCYNDTPYGDNFDGGYQGDEYSDTATSNTTPGEMPSTPIGDI